MSKEYSNQQHRQTITPESMISPSSSHSSTQQPQSQAGRAAFDDTSLEAMSAAIASAIEMANSGRPASSLTSGSASILRPGPATVATGAAVTSITANSSTKTAQINRSRSASVRSIFSSPSTRKTGVAAFSPASSSASVGNGMMARPKRSSSLSSQQSPRATSRHSSSLNRNYSARFSWFIGPGIEEHDDRDMEKTTGPPLKAASGTDETRPSQDKVDDDGDDNDGRRELMYRGIRVKEMKTTLKTMVIPHDVENPMPQIKLERPGFARINY